MIGSQSLSSLAQNLNYYNVVPDVEFSSISTDTRSLKKGDCYIALIGDRFNGNDYLQMAAMSGAVAVICSKAAEIPIPTLVVEDTQLILSAIAKENRARSMATVIALTGSQGKTSVKEMLGLILNRNGKTLITRANLNNTIGVPLTLIELTENEKFAVVEMGANAQGEIAKSVEVASPNIALITNANSAHLEGFGSYEAIVDAKGEIIDGLDCNGVLVLNANQKSCHRWIERAGSKTVRLFSYGMRNKNADYQCSLAKITRAGGISFDLFCPQGELSITWPLLGEHNVENALAAAACALEGGAELDQVKEGLIKMRPIPGRLYLLKGINACTIIDDTYNASPSSFYAAINVLAAQGSRSSTRTVLVVGDMLELGSAAEMFHAKIGDEARLAGITDLWAIGAFADSAVRSFGAGGVCYERMDDLVADCVTASQANVMFLAKGSRGSRMERIVDVLKATDNHGN
ncbi:MAG: UDP-N-acetylmuramoyl-tripeptide--D-alanyl-D-alanine ligase [Gammaproteobacteria bacterium]|nr:UDP-N-acetylmuramoyl-tripeptide--D-alanyl-D-alanine ligase [Gammaproteobacteria bacterium]